MQHCPLVEISRSSSSLVARQNLLVSCAAHLNFSEVCCAVSRSSRRRWRPGSA